MPQLARQTQASCCPCMMVRTSMFTQEVVNAIAAALYGSVLLSTWSMIQADGTHQSVRTATLRMDGVNWLSRSGQTKSEVRRMFTHLGKKRRRQTHYSHVSTNEGTYRS